MDWFLYDNGLRHESVNLIITSSLRNFSGVLHDLLPKVITYLQFY